MKKLIMFFTGLIIFGTYTANASDDKPITFEQLPTKSQQFIKKHFSNEKIALSKMENDFMETRYEVVFNDNKKIEFLKNGEWKEVDCGISTVPSGIIPSKISAKVKDLYPEASITEIDRDKRDYEVKLSNNMELTFDLKFNLIDMDN